MEAAPATAMPVYPVPAQQSMPQPGDGLTSGARARARDHRRPERDAAVGKIEHRGPRREDPPCGMPWLNLGVDAWAVATPSGLRPGIGLRPGGERPDLEDAVVALFDALYASVVACSSVGLNVVVDVGHHDDYSRPLGILSKVAGTCGAGPPISSACAARWR